MRFTKFKRTFIVFTFVAVIALVGGLSFSSTLVPTKQAPIRKYPSPGYQEISWQGDGCRAREPLERRLFQVHLRGVEADVASSLSRHFLWLCKRYHFDPLFISAVIGVESGFNPNAISPVGATGLMQLMPTTAAQILEEGGAPEIEPASLVRELSDPFLNLTIGIKYLAQLRDHYHGRAQNFLAAYHGGPARVDEVLSGKRKPLASSLDYVRTVRIALGLFRLEVPRYCRETGRKTVHSKKI